MHLGVHTPSPTCVSQHRRPLPAGQQGVCGSGPARHPIPVGRNGLERARRQTNRNPSSAGGSRDDPASRRLRTRTCSAPPQSSFFPPRRRDLLGESSWERRMGQATGAPARAAAPAPTQRRAQRRKQRPSRHRRPRGKRKCVTPRGGVSAGGGASAGGGVSAERGHGARPARGPARDSQPRDFRGGSGGRADRCVRRRGQGQEGPAELCRVTVGH